MAQIPQPTIVYSPPPYSVTDNTTNQQSWSFLFTNISPLFSNKLRNVGMCLVLIGMVAIGLEAALFSYDDRDSLPYISYYELDMFGIYLFALGFILVILCQQQVYVLTAVFILQFWQLIYLIKLLVVYSLIIKSWKLTCLVSSDVYCESKRAITISSLICSILSIILIIYNMVVIRDACNPRSRVVQQPVIPVAYLNSVATFTNQ